MAFFRNRKSVISSGLLAGGTDRHSHLLWGVDDGIKTKEESLAALDWFEGRGMDKIWLTSHTAEDMPNTTQELKERFAELKASYHGSMVLGLASEYMLDVLYERHLEERDLLTMEDNLVLVETSTWAPPFNMYDLLSQTMSAGYRPLLAHPERYGYMKMKDYEKLQTMGVRMQLNLPSLVGAYGEPARDRAQKLLEEGFYCCWGSDCHSLKFHSMLYQEKNLSTKHIDLVAALHII